MQNRSLQLGISPVKISHVAPGERSCPSSSRDSFHYLATVFLTPDPLWGNADVRKGRRETLVCQTTASLATEAEQ